MIITNKLNLPEAFVKAISNTRHNAEKTLSATTLLKGAKEIILTNRHFDEIEIDASEEVWAVFGTAVHSVLEHQEDDAFKEEKFELPFEHSPTWKITGKVDRYNMATETIEDWKTASVWKVIKKDFQEWRMQGYIYAWLLKQNGLNVRHIRFVALLKDHSKTEAKRNPDYPQEPVYIYEYDVNETEMEGAITMAVNKGLKVLEYYETPDDEIPECTEEERWTTPAKWAVMKEGRKTAVKLFDKEEDALNFIDELEKEKDKHFIEERKGQNKKCDDYCPCAAFCSYYKQTHQTSEVTE